MRSEFARSVCSCRARIATVSGHVEGDIVASGRIETADTARITDTIAGTVTGEAVAVSEAAVVEGVMKTTGRAAPVGFKEKRINDSQLENPWRAAPARVLHSAPTSIRTEWLAGPVIRPARP